MLRKKAPLLICTSDTVKILANLQGGTGIVERVENGIVYTVEGNSGDSCRQCQRAVGNYEILGYGVLVP